MVLVTHLEAERQPDSIEAKSLNSQHNVRKVQCQGGAASPKPVWPYAIATHNRVTICSAAQDHCCHREQCFHAVKKQMQLCWQMHMPSPRCPAMLLHSGHEHAESMDIGTSICNTCKT